MQVRVCTFQTREQRWPTDAPHYRRRLCETKGQEAVCSVLENNLYWLWWSSATSFFSGSCWLVGTACFSPAEEKVELRSLPVEISLHGYVLAFFHNPVSFCFSREVGRLQEDGWTYRSTKARSWCKRAAWPSSVSTWPTRLLTPWRLQRSSVSSRRRVHSPQGQEVCHC